MSKLKARLLRPICLILALVLLGSAAAAAVREGSAYEQLKDAAHNLLSTGLADNYRLGAEIYINDELYASYTEVISSGAKTVLRRNHQNGAWSYESDTLSLEMSDMSQGAGRYIYHFDGLDGHVYIFNLEWEYIQKTTKARMLTALADVAFTNYKHYLSVTEQNGERVIFGAVSDAQIPELYDRILGQIMEQVTEYDQSYHAYNEWLEQSDTGTINMSDTIRLEGSTKRISTYRHDEDGTSTLISERTLKAVREDYSENPLKVPIIAAVIDSISVNTVIDEDNRPLDGSLTGRAWMKNVFGETDLVEVRLSYSAREEGVVAPECPLSNAEELLNADALYTLASERTRHLIDQKIMVYHNYTFETNEDGLIRPDSITVDDYADMYYGALGIKVAYDIEGYAYLQFSYAAMYMDYDGVMGAIDAGDEYLAECFITATGLEPGAPYQELWSMFGND